MPDDTQNHITPPESQEAQPLITPLVTSESSPVVGQSIAQPQSFNQPPAGVSPAMDAPEPVQSQPTVSSEQSHTSTPEARPPITAISRSRRHLPKPLFIAGIGVGAALLIGGGYVFGFYLPNRPENVFSASLANTGVAVDRLLDYGTLQSKTDYKSLAFEGNMTVKSPTASFDATLNGSADQDANATLTMNADAMGEKLTAGFRSIHANDGQSPDVYLRVNGVKQLMAANGMDSLASLDGQWISIDHTLIDTYTSRLQTSGDTGTANQNELAFPTYAQLDSGARKVQAVNKQYLFTTDSSHAVLTQQKFIGQQTIDGHTLNHYTVGYNKTHFETYIDALKGAVDASRLNDWARKANSGKSLSAAMELDDLKNEIKNSKGDYIFDLWADTKTRLVSKVAFKNPNDPTEAFAITQASTSGSDYPFALTMHTKDESGNPEDALINLAINTITHKMTFGTTITSKASDGTTRVNLTLRVTPSKDAVKVEVPVGAVSLNQVMNSLGLGGFMDGTLPLGSSGSSDLPLVFEQ